MNTHRLGFMRHWRLPLGLALTVVPLCGHAADPPTRAPYRLGVGDVIEIWIAGHDELSVPASSGVQVGLDGRIRYPYLGGIAVEGLTCAEVEERIAAGLAGRVVVDPQVVVRVVQSHSQQINVLGAVSQPGLFPYRPGLTVADAAALAGGLLRADELGTPVISARLVHRDGRVETVPAAAVLGTNVGTAGPEIRAGDTVLFEAEAHVVVLGAVSSPHAVPAHEGLRLSEVLAAVGGVTAEGDLQRIIVSHRDGTVQEVDLERVVTSGQGDNPLVRPGDTVYVPPTRRQAVIFGFVNQPGRYVLREGDRVSDLVAQARGPLVGETAGDLGAVVLTRKDGSTRTLDLLGPGGRGPDSEGNPLLLPGDQVVVPQLRNRVLVSGYVRAAGSYRFQPGDRARDAIARAGGPLTNVASLTMVRLRAANGDQRVVNLEQENPELRPGDEVVVLFANNRVTVLGHVNRPGMYEWHEGDTLIDMLALAAGASRGERGVNYTVTSGNWRRVVLYRLEGDRESLRELDLTRFLQNGDWSANPEVKPGDIIYVRDKKQLNVGELLRDLLIIPRFFDLAQ